MNQRNIQVQVKSELGEPASDVTLPSHPQEKATHVQGASGATLPSHPQEKATHVQGADAVTFPSHPQKKVTHVESADAATTLSSHPQEKATHVQGASGATLLSHPQEKGTYVEGADAATTLPSHPQKKATHVEDVGASCLVSRQDNQVPMVHLKDLRLHLLSTKGDLSSGFLPPERGCLTPPVGTSISIKDEINDEVLQMAMTVNNTLHVEGRLSKSGAESEKALNHSRQPENNSDNSHSCKVQLWESEYPVAPGQCVDSSHEPKQGLSKKDSCIGKTDDGNINEASGFIDLFDENEDSRSSCSIDLTQADPDSPIKANLNLPLDSSKKHELKEHISTDDANNDPSCKSNSSQEGKEFSGKRKRFAHAESSSGMNETEDGEEGSRKKVRSSSLLHNDEDSDRDIELFIYNRSDKISSKRDSNKAVNDSGDNEQLAHEIKINKNSNDVSELSSSDDELFLHRKNTKGAKICNSNRVKKYNDSEPLVHKRNIKPNSEKRVSNEALQNNSSDNEELIFKRKTNRMSFTTISSDDSDFEDIPSKEKSNIASILNMKSCTVDLKRMPCDSISSLNNCHLKGTLASTTNNNNNVSGSRIKSYSKTSTNSSDRCKLSQECKPKPKKKRKYSVEEASISYKDEGEVIKLISIEQRDRVQKKSFDEHPSHTVIEISDIDDEKEAKSVPLLTESQTSAATSISYNSVDSEGRNKFIEKGKVSSKCNSEECKKTNKEKPRANKVELSREIKIKTESACEADNNSDNGDGEKDVFMYSQVGDEIWLSSDEEEKASPPSSPTTTSLDLDLLFMEEDEQQPSHMEVDSSSVKVEPAEVEDSDVVDVDNQWLPVLSQTFLVSSDEEEEKEEDSNKDFKGNDETVVKSEPQPGPSGVSGLVPSNESEDDEIGEWWPELSQGFFDERAEEEEEKGKEKATSSNNTELNTRVRDEPIRTDSTTDLQFVIEKLRKKPPRTTQLTEPKVSLPHLRKISQKESSNIKAIGFNSKTQEPTAIVKKNMNEQKKKKTKQENSKSAGVINNQNKQNKNLNLRKSLASKFNLDPYKATPECTPKMHHLVNKDKEKYKPQDPLLDKRMANPKAGENISIQKKTKPIDATTQDKPRPKVAAKVTKKTRSEKMIDVDLFSVPPKRTTSKQKNFKIPKSSNAGASCSFKSKAAGSGLVLNREKNLETSGNYDMPVLVDVLEAQYENALHNIQSEMQKLPISAASTSNDPTIKVIEINSLKKVKLKSSKPRHVHFPKKEEDLVKVRLISPRKKSERTGLPSVRASEMLPEQLKLQRQNIPPYYMELFVHHVCRWNYDWLENYHVAQEKYRAGVLKKPPSLPPIVTSTNYPMLILYSSYSDYIETHSSLFYLELWERIYKDWVKSNKSSGGLQSLIECVRPAFITTPKGIMKFWTLKLLVAIPQNKDLSLHNFRQGTLISLKIRKETKRSVIFGYVDYKTVNNRNMVTQQNQALAQVGANFTLGVRVVKEIIETVKSGTVFTIVDISYLRPCSRIWESLYKLPLSPLCNHILYPTPTAFSCDKKTEYLVKDLPLNEAQIKAVTEVSSKCMFNPHIPKLSLIHGPPGTGKTSTIVALIAQMAKIGSNLVPVGMPRCKVLICAPSNVAVDELTLRLIRLQDIGLSLRVVRVGFRANDHPVVRNYTLDQFVDKQVKMELSTPRCTSARQELQRRKVLLEEIVKDLEKAKKDERHDMVQQLQVRLNEMARSKAELEKSFKNEPSVHERHQLHQKWQQEFLLNAEVVTTTLHSCVSGTIAEVLTKYPYHFTCCIVDEAGQCQETETLLPLLLGIKKLVLVGDHYQLPATVLSQLALSKNLKQSLFERLHHRLVLELQREDVVHTLNVQYRMHPQIVEWPAHHFYQNKLLSEASIQPSTTLKPYMIFDLKVSKILYA